MDKYMGLHVHSTSCTLAVISSQGRRLHEAVVETDASALRNAVKAIRGTRHLCVEEGTHSAWIHEILDPCVDELVVTRGLGSRALKSDRRDAFALADAPLRPGPRAQSTDGASDQPEAPAPYFAMCSLTRILLISSRWIWFVPS